MSIVRPTPLRAGAACVRCRRGKTKCYYESGDPPCRNCAKGAHDCLLPGEVTPMRATPRPVREPLPVPERVPVFVPIPRVPAISDKLTPELMQECERVVCKTFPACVAFHKPSFIQQLKAHALDMALVYGLLTCAARTSPNLIRRYGGQNGATGAAEGFATKALNLINHSLDTPSLADIQALCLIVIHEWGTRNAVRAYVYLGQAARMLQMHRILGTHVAPSSDADRFHQEESFRRTLWLIYALDCLLTTTPGRNPALSDRDFLDVSLPCSDINFAFGNAVWVKTLHNQEPRGLPADAVVGEVGEFGHIVLAISIWRHAVSFLSSLSHSAFDEAACAALMSDITNLRESLPMQFIDRPQQINLHITMGSGFTYAMLHSALHCATIFLQRRRLLHFVTADGFSLESWRGSPECQDMVQQLFASCHRIVSLLNALEAGSDKDMIMCFPIFMLFSAFTSSATVAYLSLKGLTPPASVETAAGIVRDGLRFMQDGVESWHLIQAWLRHLSVMQRVLNNDSRTQAMSGVAPSHSALSPKEEAVSTPESNPDTMDYDQATSASTVGVSGIATISGSLAIMHGSVRAASEGARQGAREDSEPLSQIGARRSGVTTINGGSVGVSPPLSRSPPQRSPVPQSPPFESKFDGAERNGGSRFVPPGSSDGPRANAAAASPVGGSQDMSPLELCEAFEKQLLELDDLAAFMGGGV